ncbi:MAG: ATP-binding protein, partial [Vicinamibacterales bacterium]
RARSLTSQLLSFSRKQMLKLEAVSVNELVVESSALIERLIGEPVKVQLLLDPREGIVRADRGQLQQVLLNLAVNARDAMPDGGRLTIATQAEPGEVVRVMVSDTGCGMPPEVQARIFEPFFTTKEQGRGTGLGLATAYGTISQLGGTIAVDSVVGVGTRFIIGLPETSDRPARAASTVRDRRDDGCGRILVVEDEGAVRTLVSRALTRRGYDIRVAASAEDALELLADPTITIDLLLSDVVMPGMNGHALAQQLRAERPNLKVILMSGYSEEQVRSQTAARDGLVLLRKPFAITTLEDAVSGMLTTDVTSLAS